MRKRGKRQRENNANAYLVPASYCGSKRCYEDKKSALTAANKRYAEDHVSLRAYYCSFCHLWHLTKQVENIKEIDLKEVY